MLAFFPSRRKSVDATTEDKQQEIAGHTPWDTGIDKAPQLLSNSALESASGKRRSLACKGSTNCRCLRNSPLCRGRRSQFWRKVEGHKKGAEVVQEKVKQMKAEAGEVKAKLTKGELIVKPAEVLAVLKREQPCPQARCDPYNTTAGRKLVRPAGIGGNEPILLPPT